MPLKVRATYSIDNIDDLFASFIDKVGIFAILEIDSMVVNNDQLYISSPVKSR